MNITPEMWREIIIQAIGILGMGLMIFSFQMKRNLYYFIFQFAAITAFVIQFFFLGPTALSGALMNVLNAIRCIVLIAGDRLHKWYVLTVMEICFVLIGIFTYAGWTSIMLIVIEVVGTLAMWTRNGRTIRMCTLLMLSPGYLVYDAIIRSLGGMLCEIFSMTSIIVSLVRFGWNGFETGVSANQKSEEKVS